VNLIRKVSQQQWSKVKDLSQLAADLNALKLGQHPPLPQTSAEENVNMNNEESVTELESETETEPRYFLRPRVVIRYPR